MMTDNAQPPALTDEQLIEAIATRVMGWEKHAWAMIPYAMYEWTDNGVHVAPGSWNPLTDWNHTMQVAERAMEKGGLGNMRFVDPWLTDNPQRTICLAALSTFQ